MAGPDVRVGVMKGLLMFEWRAFLTLTTQVGHRAAALWLRLAGLSQHPPRTLSIAGQQVRVETGEWASSRRLLQERAGYTGQSTLDADIEKLREARALTTTPVMRVRRSTNRSRGAPKSGAVVCSERPSSNCVLITIFRVNGLNKIGARGAPKSGAIEKRAVTGTASPTPSPYYDYADLADMAAVDEQLRREGRMPLQDREGQKPDEPTAPVRARPARAWCPPR